MFWFSPLSIQPLPFVTVWCGLLYSPQGECKPAELEPVCFHVVGHTVKSRAGQWVSLISATYGFAHLLIQSKIQQSFSGFVTGLMLMLPWLIFSFTISS